MLAVMLCDRYEHSGCAHVTSKKAQQLCTASESVPGMLLRDSAHAAHSGAGEAHSQTLLAVRAKSAGANGDQSTNSLYKKDSKSSQVLVVVYQEHK